MLQITNNRSRLLSLAGKFIESIVRHDCLNQRKNKNFNLVAGQSVKCKGTYIQYRKQSPEHRRLLFSRHFPTICAKAGYNRNSKYMD
jgi:hypothetical protein